MADRQPPQSVEAEQAVLAACMLEQGTLAVARRIVSDDDWYRPGHSMIWQALLEVRRAGLVPDALSVAEALVRRGEIGKVGGHPYLHDLVESLPTTVNVEYWAEIVAQKAVLRRLAEAGERIQQRAYGAADGAGLAGSVDEAVARASQEVALVHRMNAPGPASDLLTWDQFLTKPRRPENWVIPGLIARQDVVMVLGGEGSGKSMMSRQFVQCASAGVQPFKPQVRMPAARTLAIDLEVSEETLSSEAGPMSHQVAKLGDWQGDNAFVWHHPEGLNLRDPRDQAELERRIAQCKPDLVTLGSLYNAYLPGKDSAEQIAGELRALFNRLRFQYAFALVLEHHMPQTDLNGHRPNRPYGSVQWAGWVTHGKVLRFVNPTVYEIGSFRNDRGRRDWPAGISRGGRLPVTPIWEQGELDLIREASEPPKGRAGGGW
jgi:replicative DNA helicase